MLDMQGKPQQRNAGGPQTTRLRCHRRLPTWVLAAALLAALSYYAAAGLKINEVYYHVNGPQEANQFIEIYNPGPSNAYLDGLIISDEAGSGIEGIFQFPGSGTDYPLPVGSYVIIAVDADGSDGYPPDLSTADWECHAGASDYDNPAVPNLELVGGSHDLSLYPGGDNVILADGSDTTAPIDAATIIDAVNFEGGGGELAPLAPGAPDHDPSLSVIAGYSIGRCPNGSDADYSSAADFSALQITPGLTNDCDSQPSLTVWDTSVAEGDSGTTTAVFSITLSHAGAQTVTVTYATADGTANDGIDYTATSGSLVFFPGETSRTVSVSVYGDTIPESTKYFFLNLSNPTNATIFDGQGKCDIFDDDGFWILSISACQTNAMITWASVSGRVYQLQYSSNLPANTWFTLPGDVTATGTTASKNDDTISNILMRFYRVVSPGP